MKGLVLILLLLFLVSAPGRSSRGLGVDMLGGWQPIEDPHVQEIARFAVAEQNKRTRGAAAIELKGVVKGETQVVEGTNYRLVLEASTDGRPTTGNNYYEAVVWEKPWIHYKNLTSFNPISKH